MPTAQQGMNITDSAQIAPGVVENADLASNAVSKVKVADAAIASAEIEDDSIVNSDINSAAAIADTKLAQITTAGKIADTALPTIPDDKLATLNNAGLVDGAALTGLANIPAGAGVIPGANLSALGVLATATLGSAATSLSVSFTAKKHIWVRILSKNISASDQLALTFNSDTGNNYRDMLSENGSVASYSTAQAYIRLRSTNASYGLFAALQLINIAGIKKMINGLVFSETDTPGDANSLSVWGSWNNTAAQISSIQLKSVGGVITMPAGTEITVLGTN